MKKIIYIFLLIGFGLNAQSNLLFKTDFEGTVALGDLTTGGYKYLSGSSLGYTFPEDDYFGKWGTSNSGIHMIDGEDDSGSDTGSGANIYAGLDEVTGHLGTPTTALHTKIITQGSGSTQTPWQFNNFTTDPDEFYMSCWQKVDTNFVVDGGVWEWNWRTLWQYKTKNYYLNDGSGARFSVYAMHFGLDAQGEPIYFWRLTLDNQVVTTSNESTSIIWQVDGNPTTMPRDEWFKFEIYFKYRTDNTGEAWIKINGKTEVHAINVPMTIFNTTNQEYDPMKFFMVNSLYGEDDGMEQWIDDVEIWDGIPNEDSDSDSARANAGEDKTICENETVTLTASGGSSYSWNTGATTQSITVNPTETTNYTVTVTEGSASDIDTVTVTVNSVTANAGTDKTMYEGESVTLTAGGGTSYSWNTGATTKSITVSPQETTSYTVTAKQGDCEDTDTVQVTVNKKDSSPPPAKANAGEDQTICLGEPIKLTANGGKTYVWSTGATTKSITVNPTRTTSYTVTATRGGVTNSDAVVVTVENCSAINDNDKQEELQIYPNPTSGILNISVKNVNKEFSLFVSDAKGSIVYREEATSKNDDFYKKMDLSGFDRGVYFVGLNGTNFNKVKKLLVVDK